MLAGSNFDTSRFAAAIELDGTVQGSFPFGDGRELFNPCKATDPVIENIWRTKIFKSNIFVIHKVLPKFTKILSHKYLEPYGSYCTYAKIPSVLKMAWPSKAELYLKVNA